MLGSYAERIQVLHVHWCAWLAAYANSLGCRWRVRTAPKADMHKPSARALVSFLVIP